MASRTLATDELVVRDGMTSNGVETPTLSTPSPLTGLLPHPTAVGVVVVELPTVLRGDMFQGGGNVFVSDSLESYISYIEAFLIREWDGSASTMPCAAKVFFAEGPALPHGAIAARRLPIPAPEHLGFR